MAEDPYVGLSAEDRARAEAHAAEQLAIQRKREAAARRLLAPKANADAVKAAWKPVEQARDASRAIAVTGGQENATKAGGGRG